jgi:hypothetical protein
VSRLDIDAIVARVDLDQVVSGSTFRPWRTSSISSAGAAPRPHLDRSEVIEEVNRWIIQEAVGSMTTETVGGIRSRA